jgi:hypothetical protein
MQTKRSILLSGMALAATLTLLVGQRPVVGQDGSDAAEPRRLAGTWNVTLTFPECSAACPCPGGIPNIPIPALHTYLQHGSILEISGGSPLRGPGVGLWKRLGDHRFGAHFKFFLFNPNGSRRGSEEVTSHISLAGPDAFEATATFDLFDPAGNMTAQGCVINETATRFEFE